MPGLLSVGDKWTLLMRWRETTRNIAHFCPWSCESQFDHSPDVFRILRRNEFTGQPEQMHHGNEGPQKDVKAYENTREEVKSAKRNGGNDENDDGSNYASHRDED